MPPWNVIKSQNLFAIYDAVVGMERLNTSGLYA
jgi:hypothetical protein